MQSPNVPVDVWHADEARWWDRYGAYMTYQWQLTEPMSKALRQELETDYKRFLAEPGGTLLDIGCGSGWLSAFFADQGMQVLGIDVSSEQIVAANVIASARDGSNLNFACVDFANWDPEPHRGRFSRVFVSAFLHHLPESELRAAIEKIAIVTKPSARVFFYEPLQVYGQRPFTVKLIDRAYNMALLLLLNILPNRFGWWSDRHKMEVANGYTMNSPHEAPVNVDLLEDATRSSFEPVDIKGWHLNSLGFGMQTMGLREKVRGRYEPFVKAAYRVDAFLLSKIGWRAFSLPGRFILCGVKLVRR